MRTYIAYIVVRGQIYSRRMYIQSQDVRRPVEKHMYILISADMYIYIHIYRSQDVRRPVEKHMYSIYSSMRIYIYIYSI